ncbi:MAG: sigma-70 family RNA polymerase sigma factor [Muribaculaceae bacterium]|nr:sigma-70 family RNA polymerase sigma factor [Muribaculaceae bacterium]MDE6809116.1 sigma-70 family RNA polymerase sigma factor [Muribaculaceae bacterium]
MTLAISLNRIIDLSGFPTVIGRLISFILAPDSGNRTETDDMATERNFHEIVARYDDMIVKICFGYALTRAELDDLHQDALINIWQSLPRFRGDSSVKTWIYRVTLNTCVSTVRRRRESPESDRLELYNVIDDSDDRRRMVAEMHDCISLLTPVDKAIVLAWLDEFSYDEIAGMVGMPRNTVATRLRRAKEKLKNMI